MTLPALSAPSRLPSIEQAREAWRSEEASEYARHKEVLRSQARALWPLYIRWIAERSGGNSNRREFMRWLTAEEQPPTRLYDLLSAGAALQGGLDYDLGISDLAVLGRALDRLTAPEITDLLETGGVEAVRAVTTAQRTEGQVSVPTAELPTVRAAVQRVSESESLAAPEALALIVQAHDALPQTIRESAIHAARTGESLEDAARVIVGKMLDPRQWLSEQRCAVPGCGMASAELHHLKLDGTRFRSQEVLLPLCRAHHQAQPGHRSEAAHAQHQGDWIACFWPSQAAFWESLAALYAERLFGDGARLNAVEP